MGVGDEKSAAVWWSLWNSALEGGWELTSGRQLVCLMAGQR